MISRYSKFRKPSQGSLTYFVQHSPRGIEAYDSNTAELVASAPDEDALKIKCEFLGYKPATKETK